MSTKLVSFAEIKDQIMELNIKQCETIIALARKRISQLDGSDKAKLWNHICSDESAFHHKKMMHWGKRVTKIDQKKVDAKAFGGEWLDAAKQHQLSGSSWILEFRECDDFIEFSHHYRFYQMKDWDNEEEHITGSAEEFLEFRNRCYEKMN